MRGEAVIQRARAIFVRVCGIIEVEGGEQPNSSAA
jgi:hypothetical protein